jgi:hypothetical protein
MKARKIAECEGTDYRPLQHIYIVQVIRIDLNLKIAPKHKLKVENEILPVFLFSERMLIDNGHW